MDKHPSLTSSFGYIAFVGACIAWIFGTVIRIPFSSGVVLLPLDVAVGILVCIQVFHIKDVRKRIYSDILARYFVLLCACGAVSLSITVILKDPVTLNWGQIVVSFLYLVRIIVYGSLVWLFPQNGTSHMRTSSTWMTTLVCAGLCLTALGFAQYFLYWDLRNLFYAGWDEHVARLFGTVLDPNYMGALFITVIALLQVWRVRVDQNHIKSFEKILYTSIPILIVILSVGVVLTYSRSSYVMLITYGLLVYATTLKKAFQLVGIGLIALLLIVYTPRFRMMTEGTNLLRTASIQSRLIEYQQALEIIADNPIRGVGYNAYRYVQRAHNFLPVTSWDTDHAGAGVPNSYLFILATSGILGLGIFFKLVYEVLKELKMKQETYVYALCIGLCVHALTENTLVYPFIMFPAVFLLSYVRQIK